jgi:hypothetical protein
VASVVKGWTIVAFGAFIGFLVVVLIAGISLMRQPGTESTAVPAAAAP